MNKELTAPAETELESTVPVEEEAGAAEETITSAEKQEESVVLKYALGKIKGNSKEKDIPKKYLKELKTDRTPMALRYSRRLMRKLRAKYKNKDIIGYIKLINKDLEYPIVQGETNETYLHAGPDGSYDYNGSIFLDYGNTEDFLDTRSVLYGHNMRNGSMFGSLRNFYSESIDDSYFLIYILSKPVYFLKTSGITIEPSACWKFSTIAANVLPTISLNLIFKVTSIKISPAAIHQNTNVG